MVMKDYVMKLTLRSDMKFDLNGEHSAHIRKRSLSRFLVLWRHPQPRVPLTGGKWRGLRVETVLLCPFALPCEMIPPQCFPENPCVLKSAVLAGIGMRVLIYWVWS